MSSAALAALTCASVSEGATSKSTSSTASRLLKSVSRLSDGGRLLGRWCVCEELWRRRAGGGALLDQMKTRPSRRSCTLAYTPRDEAVAAWEAAD